MTDFTGDAGNNTITGTEGDDRIQGLDGNDILNGAGGNDLLIGGPGADILTGGTGADTFRGTASEMNGDRITDFLIGDRIQFLDLSFADAQGIHTVGNTLYYTGGSLQIDNLGPGRFVLRQITGGGIELRLQTPAHNDFNGDGRSDILWRNDNTLLTDWLGSNGGSFQNNWANFNMNAASDWKIIATGDFNGDGRSDILWRSDSGIVTNWLGTANGGFSNNWANFNMNAAADWKIIGAGDYNGDGHTDIMWRSNSGIVTNWLGTATGGFSNNWDNFNMNASSDWKIIGTADFNGDGRADILWRSDSGIVTDWLATASGGFSNNWNNFNMNAASDWKIIGTGDFNGDGLSDLLWRSDSGTVTNWLGTASGAFSNNWEAFNMHADASWHIADIGDYNGDGIDDLMWRSDSGIVTNWLGKADGGFTNNWSNFNMVADNAWHFQPEGSIV